MEIFYSPYTLTPLKRLNRSSSMEKKHGVYLKAKLNGQTTFADYFPHMAFGDKGVEQFLLKFKDQKEEYDRKVLYFLLNEHRYHSIPTTTFKNHQLWTGTEDLEASVVKYKLHHTDDETFMDPLKRGLRLRLDANGLFNREGLKNFIGRIPPELHSQIDYLEDPLIDKDWSDLGIKAARDLVTGVPHHVKVHRPNCQFFPENEPKVIFSSYLGGELGRWHTYCELVELGDLNEIHGIISRGFFAEEHFFLEGNFHDGFRPNKEGVKELYADLHMMEWKSLTTI